jgi:hypothetical protein
MWWAVGYPEKLDPVGFVKRSWVSGLTKTFDKTALPVRPLDLSPRPPRWMSVTAPTSSRGRVQDNFVLILVSLGWNNTFR